MISFYFIRIDQIFDEGYLRFKSQKEKRKIKSLYTYANKRLLASESSIKLINATYRHTNKKFKTIIFYFIRIELTFFFFFATFQYQ